MNTTVRTLRANDFNESGKLISYTITNYEALSRKDNIQYRGKCNLIVEVEGQEPVTYNGVQVSSLLAYQIAKEPGKYVDVKFTSYNTSSDFNENPLKFNISEDGQHFNLGFVTERGSISVIVALPTGGTVVEKKFLYHKPSNFLRFYQKRTSERTA